MTPTKSEIEEQRESIKREKRADKFVESYNPSFIDLEKFNDAKMNPSKFVFTKNEILQEIGWKNGTFYNRMNEIETAYVRFGHTYTKVKELGDKTEKLLFSYEAFTWLLRQYFIRDLKWGENLAQAQNNVKSNSQSSQENVKNESTNSQNDSINDDIILLYKKMLEDKDKTIEDLRGQVEDLTNIIRAKEQKDLELAKIELAKQQKQILINDAEGNRREGFFARIFGRNKRENTED